MKEYTCNNIRNIGLVGHGGVGKTSLAESMLYKMGEINRVGKIDNGTLYVFY
ncbi:MAG: GTP-binding protein [bacterium]